MLHVKLPGSIDELQRPWSRFILDGDHLVWILMKRLGLGNAEGREMKRQPASYVQHRSHAKDTVMLTCEAIDNHQDSSIRCCGQIMIGRLPVTLVIKGGVKPMAGGLPVPNFRYNCQSDFSIRRQDVI